MSSVSQTKAKEPKQQTKAELYTQEEFLAGETERICDLIDLKLVDNIAADSRYSELSEIAKIIERKADEDFNKRFES